MSRKQKQSDANTNTNGNHSGAGATDPYATLGVSRSASKETIRKRGRRKLFDAHPDRNPGDPSANTAIAKIKAAYDLLMDDERRAHFDATGDTADHRRAADNTEAKMFAELSQCFEIVVGGIVSKGHDPAQHDIVAEMKKTIGIMIRELETTRAKMTSTKKKLDKLLGRFTVKDAENIFESRLRSNSERQAAEIAEYDEKIKVMKAAYDFMKRVNFRVEPTTTATTGSATTGSSRLAGSAAFVEWTVRTS